MPTHKQNGICSRSSNAFANWVCLQVKHASFSVLRPRQSVALGANDAASTQLDFSISSLNLTKYITELYDASDGA